MKALSFRRKVDSFCHLNEFLVINCANNIITKYLYKHNEIAGTFGNHDVCTCTFISMLLHWIHVSRPLMAKLWFFQNQKYTSHSFVYFWPFESSVSGCVHSLYLLYYFCGYLQLCFSTVWFTCILTFCSSNLFISQWERQRTGCFVVRCFVTNMVYASLFALSFITINGLYWCISWTAWSLH